MYGVDDGTAFTAHVEPGAAPPLVDFLDRMRFMMRVEVEDLTDELAVAWRPGSNLPPTAPPSSVERSRDPGKYDVFPRSELEAYAEAAGPACGMWAFEALRIARGEPRFGLDTDHRTIPNEVGWIPSAVHLDKGCYRGQETVARVHNLGRPPRRLTLLHLDGSENRLPTRGAPVTYRGRAILAGRRSRDPGRHRRQLRPPLRGRPDRPCPAQAKRPGGRPAGGRRARRRPGGRRRPRGRSARPSPALRATDEVADGWSPSRSLPEPRDHPGLRQLGRGAARQTQHRARRSRR